MKKITLLATCAILLSGCLSNTDYPTMTACLEKNQVVMFGASWCPHCASQKQMFGRSLRSLPYFECSKNGAQVPECNERGIASYPTWQFQETTLANLPKEAMLNLLNGEITKVRGTSEVYREAAKDKPELLSLVKAFEEKTEKMIASDLSEFEKLKKLAVLSEDTTGNLVEKPVYVSGRIAGERPLAEIALYAGCNSEYQTDTAASKQ